ncbi:MAG: arginine deiminase [Bacillota bacterium]
MASSPFMVRSEIGNLKKVLLHRPGLEIERLTPALLDRLLFDDIPYLKVARQEHDDFAQVLRDNGVEVKYLEKMTAEALENSGVREKFIAQFLDEGGVNAAGRREALQEWLSRFDNEELVTRLMAGVQKKEIPNLADKTLAERVEADYAFILDPMPNLYFTRDPFATIGRGISLNHMHTETRNRETIFAEYIFNFHPDFQDLDIPRWYSRYDAASLEGGDQLVLSSEVLALGISQRSEAAAIEKFAETILNSEESFDTVLALKIPSKRAFMHLDTVFTMVDYDKFTIHAEIEGPLVVYSLTRDGQGSLKINQEKYTLEEILKSYLGLNSVELIRCAGGDPIAGGREQWNDGSNTLAISPGEVIVYDRNYVTNDLLEEAGVTLHKIKGSELARGRGGPRCMSMPLQREKLSNQI